MKYWNNSRKYSNKFKIFVIFCDDRQNQSSFFPFFPAYLEIDSKPIIDTYYVCTVRLKIQKINILGRILVPL